MASEEITGLIDDTDDRECEPSASATTSFSGHAETHRSKLPTCTEFLAAMAACIGALCIGICIGYSSPTGREMGLSDDQSSWFASFLAVGGVCGAPIATVLVSNFGRKLTILISGVPMTFGWFCIVFAKQFALLLIGRFLTGVSAGMLCLTVPIYIAEIVTKDVRGLLGSAFQLLITTGILLVYSASLILTYKWLAVLGSACCSFMVIAMLIMPDSPVFLFKMRSVSEAVATLKWLRGRNVSINKEQQEIENILMSDHNSVTIGELIFDSTYRKPLLLSCLLMLFQQLSGVNAFLFYADNIFEVAGFENATLPSIALAAVQVIFTFIGCIVMDYFGRRVLLIGGGSVQVFCCFTMGLFYLLSSLHIASNTAIYMKLLSVGSLCVFISAFSVGWGPIPWLLMSEIFRLRARGLSSGIVTVVSWSAVFVVAKCFVIISNAITSFGTFFMLSLFNLLSVIFVAIFVPETKGRSLQEIENLLSGNVHN